MSLEFQKKIVNLGYLYIGFTLHKSGWDTDTCHVTLKIFHEEVGTMPGTKTELSDCRLKPRFGIVHKQTITFSGALQLM